MRTVSDVSKSISPVERRVIVNPNWVVVVVVVLWRVKLRSEAGSERRSFDGIFWSDFGGKLYVRGWRGRTWVGISHLWCLASVIRILKQSVVSKLYKNIKFESLCVMCYPLGKKRGRKRKRTSH